MKIKFTAKVWIWPGETANWYFVSLPKKNGVEIKEKLGKNARGWGSLRVKVTIGETSWNTSIFPDKKGGTYILPLKAQVRKKEGIYADDTVSIELEFI